MVLDFTLMNELKSSETLFLRVYSTPNVLNTLNEIYISLR